MEVTGKDNNFIQSPTNVNFSVTVNENQFNDTSNQGKADSSDHISIIVDERGEEAPLIQNGRDGVNSNEGEAFYETEVYKGFQKITTIPAAIVSIIVSFIMIASVCYSFLSMLA